MERTSAATRTTRGRDDRRDDQRGRDAPANPLTAYALTKRGEQTYWTRIGIAFVNCDDSITVKMDALPVAGTIQIRDEEQRGDERG